MTKKLSFLVAFAALTALSASIVRAQVVIAPSTPQIGSSNPVSAAPLVPRPNTKPCVVSLFNNLAFDNFTPASFSYAPPADCPGPWAKVVFTADFTVSAGRQFDRTAAFYLGHASIYYGTTAEPRAALSPSWHVERDVTDLSAIFKSDQTGEANIGNFVGVYNGVTYNGIIYANAALEFYPANFVNPAPRVPDVVVPVNGGGGDAGTLNTTTDTISQVLNLPENVESVYLDVIAQNQSNDEFFYFCVPNDQAANLLSCGNTAYRETEITIDGTPAGVAPVYPWIFTGGIDPYLWEPIPGNQTLVFKPYRVNLTPFAGLLSDGNMHTVAVSIFNADSYFLATANLLVYEDHHSSSVTGGVLENTLSAAPTPVVKENISYNSTSGDYTGTLAVSSNREFTIKGYVNTSHGRVATTVSEKMNFINTQEVDVNPATFSPDMQNVQQLTTVDSWVTTQDGFIALTSEEHFSYPLNINYFFQIDGSGNELQNTTVDQKFLLTKAEGLFGFPIFTSNTFEETKAQDDINFTTGAISNTATSQTYQYKDSRGGCYDKTLTAANKVLTGVATGCDRK
jgi:Peptide N-acetyl-beta-D-glucosaminyl asparaginase amidase A